MRQLTSRACTTGELSPDHSMIGSGAMFIA
jgi:hypothetical protein